MGGGLVGQAKNLIGKSSTIDDGRPGGFYIARFRNLKEKHPNFIRGGLKDGYVKMSAYGPMVPDAAKKEADGVKAKMIAGTFDIFKGPLKDNKGNMAIAAGTTHKQTDLELEKMNYLVEGVIGSAG